MFIALYRWRIKAGKEAQFIAAWSEITAYYRENWDSLGSRLHRGDDGIYYGYAQWNSAADRDEAFANNSLRTEVRELMNDAIEERLETTILEKMSDYLVLPEKI